EYVAESVFLALYQIHHRARDRLFAFEGGDARTFTEAHSALIDLRHLGRFHSFVASFVINYEETLVAYNLVLVEYFFRPGKITFRIDVFDIDLPLCRVLIFRQQSLHVGRDRCARRKENDDPHLAFDCAEETLRLVRKRILLSAREMRALAMFKLTRMQHPCEIDDKN